MRSLIRPFALASATAVLLAGCSGKPENSPALRKKFAEYDKATESVTQMTTEIASLREEVTRLASENSELRAFVPTIDGQSSLDKLSTIEARLAKVEGLAASRAIAQASNSSTSTPSVSTTTTERTTSTNTASRPSLDTAPLAVVPTAPAETTATTAAAEKPASTTTTTTTKTVSSTTAAPRQPVIAQQQASRTEKAAEVAKPVAEKKATPAKAKTETAAARTRFTYHMIKAGDTPQSIATQYNVPVATLLKENRLPNGARLSPGQRIYVPASK